MAQSLVGPHRRGCDLIIVAFRSAKVRLVNALCGAKGDNVLHLADKITA